ncbi:hypothetical protein [Puniceibacterium sediminis]|uniref:Uncharacterized protein n=1 Tax=Puniceibacterium sediminis TaxID=1608407 RepID=A0A238UW25_9RHOB|nr:hypothetical protein [Puniceibacterium sediminis]SNR26081.1 hypothetical protein SAMN06265370_101188 [Puniceibacterium sediminis]
MAGLTKILKVSYGSFACTFEGFDDPFVAIKAITEYLHDIARDDPDFCAPPRDAAAQKLAEIVGRESGVSVEARIENSVYVLRAPAPSHQTAPPAARSPDSIDAKLRRIRDVVMATRGGSRATGFQNALSKRIGSGVTNAAPAAMSQTTDPRSGTAPHVTPGATTIVRAASSRLDLSKFAIMQTETEGKEELAGKDIPAGPRPNTDKFDPTTGHKATATAPKISNGAKNDRRNSGLTPEQQAELARELAEIRAMLQDDFVGTENDTWDVPPAQPAVPPTVAGNSDEERDAVSSALDDAVDDAVERVALDGHHKAEKTPRQARFLRTENLIAEGDTSVDRILQETNTQLREPEADRRRSAIAHLRAAVSATRADRILRRKTDVENAADPYRADLANTVLPKGLSSASAPAAKANPNYASPAPLTLVAAQRVDRRASDDGDTPSPRDPETAKHGFGKFAENMGAHALSEQLEAAASYLSFVEGHEEFSRPQLMIKVSAVETTPSSREDRLQTFGRLVREGKILKAGDGRFTASERIRFKPGTRAAG